MTTSFHPVSEVLGVEIRGIDPRGALTEEESEAIRAKLFEYGVVLFRGIELEPEDQVRVTETAGTVTERLHVNGNPYGFVSNAGKGGLLRGGLFGNGELSFHSDYSFSEKMILARSLYALVLPPDLVGGETLFADAALAYEDLPEETKEQIDDLQGLFSVTFGSGEDAEVQETVRPLVEKHPVTGRPLLMASRAVTKEIVGMERAEFRPLLKSLWAHLEEPRHIYAHVWQVNDLVLWDNYRMQHARNEFDSDQERTLRAVSVDN
jgi:taurine dioxygenase